MLTVYPIIDNRRKRRRYTDYRVASKQQKFKLQVALRFLDIISLYIRKRLNDGFKFFCDLMQ